MSWRGPLTHRQFVTWQFWLRERWGRPSLTDFHLAQVAQEVFAAPFRVWDGRFKGPQLRDFVLEPVKDPLDEGGSSGSSNGKEEDASTSSQEALPGVGFKLPRKMTKADIVKAEIAMSRMSRTMAPSPSNVGNGQEGVQRG